MLASLSLLIEGVCNISTNSTSGLNVYLEMSEFIYQIYRMVGNPQAQFHWSLQRQTLLSHIQVQ